MDRTTALEVLDRLAWINTVVTPAWVLFTGMLVVALALLGDAEQDGVWPTRLVVTTIAAIWTYPIYTLGFRLVPGIVGNVGLGLLVVVTVAVAARVDVRAGLLAAPILPWLGVATTYAWAELVVRRTV